MLFFADSRLIFQAVIGGQYKIVEFSEPDTSGTSTCHTTNEELIAAIRKHKFYRQGKIRERAEAEPVKREEKPLSDDIMEFGSYSQLKSYLKKTFKNDERAKKIKTPDDVANFAKEHGVVYRFKD